MNKIIKKFLEEQQFNSGQLYKICPDKFLKDFVKFVDKDKENELSKILFRNPIRQLNVYQDLINLQKKY